MIVCITPFIRSHWWSCYIWSSIKVTVEAKSFEQNYPPPSLLSAPTPSKSKMIVYRRPVRIKNKSQKKNKPLKLKTAVPSSEELDEAFKRKSLFSFLKIKILIEKYFALLSSFSPSCVYGFTLLQFFVKY